MFLKRATRQDIVYAFLFLVEHVPNIQPFVQPLHFSSIKLCVLSLKSIKSNDNIVIQEN